MRSVPGPFRARAAGAVAPNPRSSGAGGHSPRSASALSRGSGAYVGNGASGNRGIGEVDIPAHTSWSGGVRASGKTGQAPRGTRAFRVPGALCTLCDHFAVRFKPNCGTVQCAKWARDVLVTGEACIARRPGEVPSALVAPSAPSNDDKSYQNTNLPISCLGTGRQPRLAINHRHRGEHTLWGLPLNSPLWLIIFWALSALRSTEVRSRGLSLTPCSTTGFCISLGIPLTVSTPKIAAR
jgi:hypothetical protein